MPDKSELTPTNFIRFIKIMNEREKKKIRLEELFSLIMQAPDNIIDAASSDIEGKLVDLTASIEFVKTVSSNNAAEILNLQVENKNLVNKNIELNDNNDLLKVHVKSLEHKIVEHDNHLNAIEKYLRVNNLEIVGIPAAESGDTIENTLINIFNKLPDMDEMPITPNDIDICHVIPSQRKDGKLVAVCKFVSRKIKYKILKAKKTVRNYKYKNNDIFINDHLSPFNRHLFALASIKKRELGCKFLWTREGLIFMRYDEKSPVINIFSEECINNIIINHPVRVDIGLNSTNVANNSTTVLVDGVAGLGDAFADKNFSTDHFRAPIDDDK